MAKTKRKPKEQVKPRWTVVQHSGFGYAGKSGFAKAIETRQLRTLADQELVLKAGGKIFDSYKEASEYEEEKNLAGEGIYPNVDGSFSDETIDGLRIYIPK